MTRMHAQSLTSDLCALTGAGYAALRDDSYTGEDRYDC